jgi:hypothetical protein
MMHTGSAVRARHCANFCALDQRAVRNGCASERNQRRVQSQRYALREGRKTLSHKLILVGVGSLFLLALASKVQAEPPSLSAYVNRKTGACGQFREGFRDEQRTPLDREFRPLGLPWKTEECQRLLDQVLAYPEALRTPSRDALGEAATKLPCEQLTLSLPVSPEHTCKALGYHYVGDLPASVHPCYPSLAPFLGASCAPLIWIHLAVLSAVLGGVGVGAYWVLKRRAQRLRAMARAGQDEAPR